MNSLRRFKKDNSVPFRECDGNLQGKVVEWLLLGESGTAKVPYFRTTSQQLTSYVPYVERDSLGKTYTWRMIDPKDPTKAISIPYYGRYRIRFFDNTGALVAGSDYITIEANKVVSGTFTLADSVDEKKIAEVLVFAYINESPSENRYGYRWRFDVLNKGNEGLVDATPLTSPISLDIDEEAEITFKFGDDYRSSFINNDTLPELVYENPGTPVLIGDKSILKLVSWGYDTTTKEAILKVKALKKGETTISIIYHNDSTDFGYYTIPTRVLVAGGNDDNGGDGGGSGGCSAAGFGFATALMAGAVLMKRKNKR